MRVMLVDNEQGRSALLEQALKDAGYDVVARVSSENDLYAIVNQSQPDIIIVDMEVPDRDTLEHMRSINRNQPKPIVMFAEQDDSSMIDAAMKAGVSAYVVDGLDFKRIKPIINVAVARFREYLAMRKDLEEAKSQLADRKLVERAKGILMQRRGYSEEEAYKAMRKLAMDRNKRLAEIAESIIATADLLG
jgi:response regulator NasT